MSDLDLIAARNVVEYLEASGRSIKWVTDRIAISEEVFLQFLVNGENAALIVPKLNKLFWIEELNHFYQLDFKPPRTLEELEATSTLYKQVCLVSEEPYTKSAEFKETIDMLDDLMNIIFTLKIVKEIG